jgi:glutathione S-transferase
MIPLLYDHPLSSYAQKVKIVLREKGVAFTAELPASFGTARRDDGFAAASPRHEVPALVAEDATIFDSTVICEYAEDRWPAPRSAGPTPRRRGWRRRRRTSTPPAGGYASIATTGSTG